MPRSTIEITLNAIGEQLDRALAIAMPNLSHTQIQKLIEGDIRSSMDNRLSPVCVWSIPNRFLSPCPKLW